jgi:hypothetical protein
MTCSPKVLARLYVSCFAPFNHQEEKAEPRMQVFDLERRPGPLEERLDRIEVMLAKLIPQHAGAGEREVNGGSRLSNLTAVETRTSPKAHTAEMV